MNLYNESRHSDQELLDLVDIAFGKDIDRNLPVNVVDRFEVSPSCGWYWNKFEDQTSPVEATQGEENVIARFSKENDCLIFVQIDFSFRAKPLHFPDFFGCVCFDTWQERFLFVVAHEAYHHDHFCKRVKTNLRTEEYACNTYANDVLQATRKNRNCKLLGFNNEPTIIPNNNFALQES